ncbi:MAG TPA: DNA adenine methylase [Granulicella sp.]|jgi:DNA adenine methylase|nr:DNA adenine methylase [Granulicella sp.]
MPNSEENYYKVRETRPTSEVGRAARFVYLTSLSFNGIYRQNLKGVFNVPYGYKATKQLPTYDELLAASVALKGATLMSTDFEEATASAESGDTVYFDPPYTVAHNNNGFVKYNASIF